MTNLAISLSLVVLSIVMPGVAQAEKLPPIWGYGIKHCDQYLRAVDGNEQGEAGMAAELERYEDWLTGFVSGLNLATGMDVLRGADIQNALRHIRAYCGGHRKEDVFTATMDLVRMLSGLR